MTRREEAKQENREKIKAAALEIILTQGMDKLTMRHLAKTAGLSLRTPYNLFGSKADVLLALLEDAMIQLASSISAESSSSAIERLFHSLSEFERLCGGAREQLYRSVFWGLMTVEQDSGRQAGYAGLASLLQALFAQGVEREELEGDPQEWGEHFAVLFLSVMGMWASGFFDLHAGIVHVRRAFEAQLPTELIPIE
ncbi:MAG: TetR/AcrR family transcriptional regulator [Myxococcota bacterium]